MANILFEQLGFDFDTPVEDSFDRHEAFKPEWQLKAEKFINSLTILPGYEFQVPKNKYQGIRLAIPNYLKLNYPHQEYIHPLTNLNLLFTAGRFITDGHGKVKQISYEDEILFSSHLAKQGFTSTARQEGSWVKSELPDSVAKKFTEKFKHGQLEPFPGDLKDFSQAIYAAVLHCLEKRPTDYVRGNLVLGYEKFKVALDNPETEFIKPEYVQGDPFSYLFFYSVLPDFSKANAPDLGKRTERLQSKFKQYLIKNHYLDASFDENDVLEHRKSFFTESFRKAMSENRLAEFPPELAELNPVKQKLFANIGRFFGIPLKEQELSTSNKARLEDFGEDLGNTRKGKHVDPKEKGNKGSDLKNKPFFILTDSEIIERVKTEPLESIWPKKEILNLYEKNPKGAAVLWCLRKELGEKRPRTGLGKLVYNNNATRAISLHRDFLKGINPPDQDPSSFDSFYYAATNYTKLLPINPKYWEYIPLGILGEKRFEDYFRTCNCLLSDGSDYREYKFHTLLPRSEDKENLLEVIDCRVETEEVPYYAAAVGNTYEEFKANIEKQLQISLGDKVFEKEKSSSKTEKKPKPERPIELYGRGNRRTHTYEIYGKQGTIELQLTDKIEFTNDDGFWAYIAEHKNELETKYREFRADFSKGEKEWRNSPIRERVGPDYRQGKDVTPELFQTTFGFRGVEFGNWVQQGKNARERQWMLNNAFDSLYDLSTILGIEPKAVALNGDLGLCFGSRGHGSASAHYETKSRVINLTKTKGYSSLAHEWFHALDHHLGRNFYQDKYFETEFASDYVRPVQYVLSDQYKKTIREKLSSENLDADCFERIFRSVERDLKDDDRFNELGRTISAFDYNIKVVGRKEGFQRVVDLSHTITTNDLQEEPLKYANVMRPEVFYAWGETIDSIRSSSMHTRMQRKSQYWNSKVEEAARSFEAFVEIRSKELGIQNDFLTNNVYSEKEKDKFSSYPYLDGRDVPFVKEKFQKLFDSMKTRVTEKGVELYSKSREQASGLTKAETQTVLEKTFGKHSIDSLINAGLLEIVSGEEEVIRNLTATKESKRNTQTGFVVPDELAYSGNPDGIIAMVNVKENLKFPSGKVIVKEGYHIALQHRGFGAKHLTGNLLEHPQRDLYKILNDKTEVALLSLKDVLQTSTEVFRTGYDKYVFYSSKFNRAVPCTFDEHKKVFSVITDRPVRVASDRYKLWGVDSVRLSGALVFPDHVASVTTPSLIPDIEQKQNGTQPVKSHEDLYTNVDYTKEIEKQIIEAKSKKDDSKRSSFVYIKSNSERIQGVYDPNLKKGFLVSSNLSAQTAPAVLLHEVGIHMAYDSSLRSKVQPLIEQAPKLIEAGFTKRDPVCMATELRLNDAGISNSHPHYAEEAAAYLVEECYRQRASEPVLLRWYKQLSSTMNVWLIEHGFKDESKLKVEDFLTIVKSNIKALAQDKGINRLKDSVFDKEESKTQMYSKSTEPKTGSTRAEIRDILKKSFGNEGICNLVGSDMFYLANSESEALMIAKQMGYPNNQYNKVPVVQPGERILGFYEPNNATSFLIAQNLSKDNAVPVILHEIGVHMAHDSQLFTKTNRIIEQANDIYKAGLLENDPLMQKVESRLTEGNIVPTSPAYKEEVCGYLIEEAAKTELKKNDIVRWFDSVKSHVKVWLVEHGVKDVSTLKATDLATIAKSNVKELAKDKQVYRLSEEGKKILTEHIKTLSTKYKTLKEADKEIKSLYQLFVELERTGKPLPPAPKQKQTEKIGVER